MKIVRKIAKWILAIILIPVVYLLISLILIFIPVNKETDLSEHNNLIYISSNGVHLDIIIPRDHIDLKLLDGLKYSDKDKYFSFGWGDRNFYLNTPYWSDLTIKTTVKALFLKSSSLIHLTKYSTIQENWLKVNLNKDQLNAINLYINKSFYLDSNNKKKILKNEGYWDNDDFYEALGNFNCFKTCNTWVNSGLKKSKIRACLWTPFDFGVLRIYKN
ncbi:DUF2459 domain-containing protein [Bacteroidota bacterium]